MSVTVLGSYPDNIVLSDKVGARRFHLGPSTWAALGPAGQWDANRYFLDAMVAARDRFVFSDDPRLARPGTWFYRELRYLTRVKRVPISTVPTWT